MGNWLSKLKDLFTKKEARYIFIGLDGAGKTTLLYKMHLGEVVNTIPTIGFNVETIEYNKTSITMWDIGGQDKIRSLWRHYYQNVNGVVFVIDSLDKERMSDAIDELNKAITSDELINVPVVIFANKQDVKGCMSVTDILKETKSVLTKTKRPWHIQGCSAIQGTGIFEGIQWLTEQKVPL